MEPLAAVEYSGDFRSGAVLASNRFCVGAGVDPADRDLTAWRVSLCLPASENLRGAALAVRHKLMHAYGVMVALLLCGSLTLVAGNAGPINTPFGSFHVASWIATLPFLAGWTMLCGIVDIEHGIVRRHIKARGTDRLPFPLSEPSIMFRIEDPATHKAVKFLIDDVAIAWCDASRGVMQLEGFAYRYVIWAHDICSLERLSNRYLHLRFRVGGSDQVLALAIAMNGATIELRRQLSLGMAARAVEAPFRRVFGFGPSETSASNGSA